MTLTWLASRDHSAMVHAAPPIFKIIRYRAESRGHPSKPANFSGLEASAFAAVTAVCEFRVGRGESPMAGLEKMPQVSLEMIQGCLRKLAESVERHTKLEGRQGYLTFIHGFLK